MSIFYALDIRVLLALAQIKKPSIFSIFAKVYKLCVLEKLAPRIYGIAETVSFYGIDLRVPFLFFTGLCISLFFRQSGKCFPIKLS